MILLIAAGFGPSIAGPSNRNSPATALVIAHGTVLLAWTLLFITQAALVATGRAAVHRRLGVLGFALATAVIILGHSAVLGFARRHYDLGLALEAARRGCSVTAIDASPTAIARIRAAAQQENLPVEALEGNAADIQIQPHYDTIVAIGLLMFFPEQTALTLLERMRERVRPGGHAIVNVLIEGTTFMSMFTPGEYYLFRREELVDRFAGWSIEAARYENFPAPGDTIKAFATVIARRPAVGSI